MKRSGASVALLLWCTLLHGTAGAAYAEIIDRIMAVVVGRVILLSDVRAFRQLMSDLDVEASDSASLTALIDRELILVEVDRYALGVPNAAAVDAFVSEARARIGPAAFDEVLRVSGWTSFHVRRVVEDSLRIERYLEERFTAAAAPTDEEALRYYGERTSEFLIDGAVQPFESVRETIQARLAAERRLELISDWVEELQQRADVTRLDGVPR